MQTLNRLKSERPRKKYDFYETPIELCVASLERVAMDEGLLYPSEIVDAGAGKGVWGLATKMVFPYDSFALLGIEHQELKMPPSYHEWWVGDYLEYPEYDDGVYDSRRPDFIMGNPPYSLAEEFVRKSWELLVPDGYIFFLLRLAFLESKKRHFGLFTEMPPKKVYVLSRRPSFFSSDGKRKTTDALSYAMFLWQKGWEGNTMLDWLYWEYDK